MLAALVADEGDEEPFCILHAQNSKWKEGRGKRGADADLESQWWFLKKNQELRSISMDTVLVVLQLEPALPVLNDKQE